MKLKLDHRIAECAIHAAGKNFRVKLLRDFGHYDNTDRALQVIGIQIRQKINAHGSALVAPQILEKLRA